MTNQLIVSAIVASLCGTGGSSVVEAAESSVEAIWQENEMIFTYSDFTTRYSCQGMRTKVRQLLDELGARAEKVTSYGCSAAPFEPAPVVNVKMRFSTLRPRGEEEDGEGEGGEPVEAVWKETTLSSNRPTFLARGDCQLVRQFTDRVLPAFAHEVLSDRTRCIPHQADGSFPSLRVRVLVAAPPPEESVEDSQGSKEEH
jgi:hypothetical protein